MFVIGGRLPPQYHSCNGSLAALVVGYHVLHLHDFRFFCRDLILLQKDFRLNVLEQFPPEAQHFGDTETAFYKQIIQESCRYIVNIASSLPAFSERTFAEVLKRESTLLNKAEEILEELRRMRKQLDPQIESERFEIEYREAIARNLDVLQLVGADVSLPNRRHKLSVAYITLSVERKQMSQPPHNKDTKTSLPKLSDLVMNSKTARDFLKVTDRRWSLSSNIYYHDDIEEEWFDKQIVRLQRV